MIIVIDGEPKAKVRHRFNTRKGFSYDPQDREKKIVRNIIKVEYQRLLNHPDPIIQLEASNLQLAKQFYVDLTFYLPFPKNLTNSKRNRILWGLADNPTKKDVDNLAKFYLDCSNKILFDDDRLISKLTTRKKFSSRPKTVLKIMAKNTQLCNDFVEILSVYGPEEILDLIELSSDICIAYDEASKYEDTEISNSSQLEQLAKAIQHLASSHHKLLKKVSSISNKTVDAKLETL